MGISISVVVPVFNEEKSVKKTLNGLKKIMETTKKSFEIIAVDDGSTDNSTKLIKRISGVKLIKHTRNKGYGSSLKTGVRMLKSSCLDDLQKKFYLYWQIS